MARREFDPLDIFLQLESDMIRSAESAMRAVRFQPSVDMHETSDALVITIEAAGVRPDRLSVTLSADDRLLTISGERPEPEDSRHERVRCYHLEIYYGPFERRVVLPQGVPIDRDAIAARYRDGFLTVTLPKAARAPAQARSITISRG